MASGPHRRLPLLLTDDVQFPCTRVRLPLAGALLCDLLVRPPEDSWLGGRRGAGAGGVAPTSAAAPGRGRKRGALPPPPPLRPRRPWCGCSPSRRSTSTRRCCAL